MQYKTDQDKPFTWVKYREGLCVGCRATCCTMPVEVKIEDLLRLELISEDDLEFPKKVFKTLSKQGLIKSYRAGSGLFLFEPKSNGDCPFLGSDRLCTVYAKRPGVCRDFPQRMGRRIGYCPVQNK